MSYWAIFQNNNNNDKLFRVAESDSVKNTYYPSEFFTSIAMTDQQAEQVLTEVKDCSISRSDNTLVLSDADNGDNSVHQTAVEYVIENIDTMVQHFTNSNKQDTSYNTQLTNWANNLKLLDLSSVTFPVSNSTPKKCLKDNFSQTRYSDLLIP